MDRVNLTKVPAAAAISGALGFTAVVPGAGMAKADDGDGPWGPGCPGGLGKTLATRCPRCRGDIGVATRATRATRVAGVAGRATTSSRTAARSFPYHIRFHCVTNGRTIEGSAQ
jgi:hypothetical protein